MIPDVLPNPSTESAEEYSRELLRRSQLPAHEAERLLGTVTGASRSDIVGGLAVDGRSAARFHLLARRRLEGEPLQYLEGTVQFGPIGLEIDGRVLIPRPETEQLWERAMNLLPAEAATVVDLGTGSGCLALAIKHERPDVMVVATDISAEALEVARRNAALLDLEVEFRHGDRLGALEPSLAGDIAMIVTNPPYVSEEEWAALPLDVRNHEPRVALAIGDGLEMYRYLAAEASDWLALGGVLVSEIGDRQGKPVKRLFDKHGWEARVSTDWTERDRFLIARMGT